MDHKSWLWKKKSMEKTIFATDKANRGNEDEGILAYEAELERNLNISNEKLSTALAEIKAKDDIAKKQTSIAREAIQGWEKAEAEVLALKQELEKATQQTVASEERLYGVDAALKECMQQLRFVREEQEKRIHDAVMKTSREYEKSRIIIEEKLSESNKKLSNLNSENTHLTKALLSKEKVINELHSAKNQLDSDLSSLMSRFESTQRDNASLNYEVRVMEKELEIRNEERDFNRRTADVAHKQHLASVKKIAQLETEAQRLRVLVRKRLPGPAALAKMKNEVEMLGKKSNPSPFDHDSNTSSKQINYLTEQLCSLEEENKVLKEFITQKTNGLSASSDVDEKTSMAESWAPSCKTAGASDIGLMDDFVEMEKLAIVSVEKQETPFDKRSIERLIEIIEGISLSDGASESSTGYTVRVLQWKTCELGGVLEAFVQSCSGLLNGKVDLEKFVKELTLTLEWIVNHCFSLQDVSSMRHEMEKRFDWDDTRGELEEVKKLKDDLDNLEQKLELEVGKSESLIIKVQESEKMIESLEMELESLKVQKEKDMKGKEDLDEQLIEAIGEYNEVFENSLSVEGQGSNNSSCNQELEDRNLVEVVVESTIEPDIQTCELNEEEKRLQSEREIIAASEKLAECQETILNLGKQLKALASPINPSVPDKIICNPTYEAPPPSPPPPPPPITTATNHHRISLLDKMMAEDAARTRESTKTATPFVSVNGINGIKNQDDEEALVNFLSIVPSKKKKPGVLRKLLWRRTKTNK